jgi:hypothetical protein
MMRRDPDAVPVPRRRVREDRVTIVAASVLVLVTAFQFVVGLHRHDDGSYDAGYAAASNRASVRGAMAMPGATAVTVCDALIAAELGGATPAQLVRRDFVNGCRHAVGDAME